MIITARKKPVEIKCIQWTGKNLKEVIEFMGQRVKTETTFGRRAWEVYEDIIKRDGLKIKTLEGEMSTTISDYIIQGVNGEFYPCKEEIFNKTYDIISKELIS